MGDSPAREPFLGREAQQVAVEDSLVGCEFTEPKPFAGRHGVKIDKVGEIDDVNSGVFYIHDSVPAVGSQHQADGRCWQGDGRHDVLAGG